MEMIPVASSNLSAVGYDANSQVLRIRFHSGTYDYYGVPVNVYQSLMNASSKGGYHAAYIKDSYRYSRL